MPLYQLEIVGNYLIVVDADNPDTDIVSEHRADIRVERGPFPFINFYSKSQKRYLPAQNVFTDENLLDANLDRLFATSEEAFIFLRENTGTPFV